jgi:pimeloyl-ACP methyl ester carboxylesterase
MTNKKLTIISIILILLFLSLSLYNSGVVMHGVKLEEGYVLSQGATLRYLAWIPEDTPVKGTAVLFHGYGGSSEMMSWIGVELARQGYVAVAFDSRGHGKSSSTVSYNVSTLLRDFFSVLGAVDHVGGEVVLAGHSMGGRAVQEVGSRINASRVIVIASSPLNTTSVEKKLLVLAMQDEIFAFSNMPISRLKGWDIYVSPTDDHLTILYNPAVVDKIVSWTVGKATYTYAWPRLIVTLLLSVLAVLLMIIVPLLFLGTDAASSREAETASRLTWEIIAVSALVAPLAFLFFNAFTGITRAPIGSFILGVFYSQALGILFLYRRQLSQTKPFIAKFSPAVLLSGIALATYSYLMMHSALQPFLNVEPSIYRLVTLLVLYVLFLPPVFVLEAFSPRGGTSKVFLVRLASKAACFAVAWLVLKITVGGGFAGYFLIVVFMSLVLLIPLDLLASVIASRKIEQANVVWLPILLSILLGSVTPVT